MSKFLLSTIDNPFNPFTQFDEWNSYDQICGYNSLSFLARVVVSSSELPDSVQEQDIQAAIDEIVTENVNGLYIKVPNPES